MADEVKVFMDREYSYEPGPSLTRTLPPGRAYLVPPKVADDIEAGGFGRRVKETAEGGQEKKGRRLSATARLTVEGKLEKETVIDMLLDGRVSHALLPAGGAEAIAGALAAAIKETQLGLHARVDAKAPEVIILRAPEPGAAGNDLSLTISPDIDGLRLAVGAFEGGSDGA